MSHSKTLKSAQKKPSNNRHVSLVRSHKLLTVLVAIAVGIIGFFGYNKYLDHTNVQDMKQLLAAFEELRTDIKNTTGQDVEIKANCGSVGKFSTSYACSITLLNDDEGLLNYSSKIDEVSELHDCEILINGTESYKNSINCSVPVRLSNTRPAESIFYKYDASPGRPR